MPTTPETPRFVEVTCPFCHEADFDLIGLKIHLQRGHCDIFNETEDPYNAYHA